MTLSFKCRFAPLLFDKEKRRKKKAFLSAPGIAGGSINDGFVRWACVYAAQRWPCAGANFAIFFLNNYLGEL